MAELKRKETKSTKPPEAEGSKPTSSGLTKKREALKKELDSVLDEIDEVLEENAAEFVASYVQRGGE
jgi:ubiquitin-like protein Pup